MNIIAECNLEGIKEYREVYDRGKCVKFSPSIINDYLSRSKYVGYDKVLFIDKIMTKEKEDDSEEEEETTSGDEEEHYVQALKYNEIMELLSDA